MRVAITGGAGFIGGNLANALVARGDDVVVVDDLSTGTQSNLAALDIQFIEGSILDAETLDRAFCAADAIIHLAARGSVPRSLLDPIETNRINVAGTVEVLEAARRAGSPHCVLSSSSSIYGMSPVLPKHEGLLPQPVSPYAVSKLAAEQYALAYQVSFGLPVAAFRFFNVFGPLQPAGHSYAAVIPNFVAATLDGRPLPVNGDGHQSRDFTYVGSLVAVLLSALDRRVTAELPINLAFGGRTTLLEIVALLEEILGRRLPREHRPPRAGDVRDSQADQTRLRSLFPGLQPMDLRTGLKATIQWFDSLRLE